MECSTDELAQLIAFCDGIEMLIAGDTATGVTTAAFVFVTLKTPQPVRRALEGSRAVCGADTRNQ
jgi:hypothetical protein